MRAGVKPRRRGWRNVGSAALGQRRPLAIQAGLAHEAQTRPLSPLWHLADFSGPAAPVKEGNGMLLKVHRTLRPPPRLPRRVVLTEFIYHHGAFLLSRC